MWRTPSKFASYKTFWRARKAIEGALFRQIVRQIVLDQLRSAGRGGSKAATIRTYVTQVLQRDFHDKAVGMTLNRLAMQGLARRKGHVWYPLGRSFETREGPGESIPL